jgi:uncharacterized protein YodC (DUF2158 family)
VRRGPLVEIGCNAKGNDMSTQIKAGDNVQLKAGGPIMTVKWKTGDKAYCEWFEGKTLKGSEFTVTSLQLDDEDDAGIG